MAFESIVAVFVSTAYKWSSGLVFIPFASCTFAVFLFQVAYNHLCKSPSEPVIMMKVGVIACTVITGVLLINWQDLSQVANATRFVLGFSIFGAVHMIIYSSSNTCFTLIIPPAYQATASGVKETLVGFTRALGPFVITKIWGYAPCTQSAHQCFSPILVNAGFIMQATALLSSSCLFVLLPRQILGSVKVSSDDRLKTVHALLSKLGTRPKAALCR